MVGFHYRTVPGLLLSQCAAVVWQLSHGCGCAGVLLMLLLAGCRWDRPAVPPVACTALAAVLRGAMAWLCCAGVLILLIHAAVACNMPGECGCGRPQHVAHLVCAALISCDCLHRHMLQSPRGVHLPRGKHVLVQVSPATASVRRQAPLLTPLSLPPAA